MREDGGSEQELDPGRGVGLQPDAADPDRDFTGKQHDHSGAEMSQEGHVAGADHLIVDDHVGHRDDDGDQVQDHGSPRTAAME